MKDNFLDEIFNTGDEDEGFGFTKEDEIALFEPRKLEKYKKELQDAGKDTKSITEFDVLLDDMQGVHAERMNKILGNMGEANFVNTYGKVLPFVKPRYKAKDPEKVIPTSMTQINVTIVKSKD